MPPQGYYGTVTAMRRRKRKGARRSGPPQGYKGSVSRGSMPQANKPPRSRPRRPAPEPFTPPRVPTAAEIPLQVGALSGGSAPGYNVNTDPAVMAAQGLAAKMRAVANASALAKRKQAAIEYGDPAGVEGIDEATKKAATENPFSILKNLGRSYESGKSNLEEGLNKANLFYSGYRVKQLGEAANAYQQSKYNAATSFKGLQTDISDQLAQALLAADAQEAFALMGSEGGGYDYGGGGDSGTVPYDPGRVIRPPGGYGFGGYGQTSGSRTTRPRISQRAVRMGRKVYRPRRQRISGFRQGL